MTLESETILKPNAPGDEDAHEPAGAPVTPPAALQPMADILTLERVGEGSFMSAADPGPRRRTFGGELFGQAIVASHHDVDAAKRIHSAHIYFIRPGDTSTPVRYEVDPVRDGRSFSTRRVEAYQNDAVILTMTASFAVPSTGPAHQLPTLSAASPEGLPDLVEALGGDERMVAWRDRVLAERPVEMRFPTAPIRAFSARKERVAAHQQLWARTASPLPDDVAVRSGALGYISDMFLMSAALGPHAAGLGDPKWQSGSLDHAMWFHADHSPDEWVFYEQTGPWTGGGLCLSEGSLFDRSGRLVATTTQQGLFRPRAR